MNYNYYILFLEAVGPRFAALYGKSIEDIPGVYQQGLTVYGHNKTIIYERFLDNNVIERTVEFCTQHDVALIAYGGDEIYTQKQCCYSSKITDYHEPHPTVYSQGLHKLQLNGIKINKLILLESEDRLQAIRAPLNDYLGNTLTYTISIQNMIYFIY